MLDDTLEIDSPPARAHYLAPRHGDAHAAVPARVLRQGTPVRTPFGPARRVRTPFGAANGAAQRKKATPGPHAKRVATPARQRDGGAESPPHAHSISYHARTPVPRARAQANARRTPRRTPSRLGAATSRMTPGLFGKAERVKTPGVASRKGHEVRDLMRSAGKDSCKRVEATEYRLEVMDGGEFVSPCRRSTRQKQRSRADVLKAANARLAVETAQQQQQQQQRCGAEKAAAKATAHTPSRHARAVATDSPIVESMLEAAHFSYKPLGTSAMHHAHGTGSSRISSAKSPVARKALRRLSGDQSLGFAAAEGFRKQLKRRAIIASDIFARMDTDASGGVSKEEFARGYCSIMSATLARDGSTASPKSHGALRQAARAVFALLDSDRDGRITFVEFKALYRRRALEKLEVPNPTTPGAMPRAVAESSKAGRRLGAAELTALAQGLLAASYVDGGANLEGLFNRMDTGALLSCARFFHRSLELAPFHCGWLLPSALTPRARASPPPQH